MINFIICDDNNEILKKIKEIIENTMMNNDTGYVIHSFNDYDSNFKEIMKSKVPNKIYILDIETPSSSGIDIARKIRNFDYESVIIFLTAHEELGYTILQKEFLFLSFINKYDNYEPKLLKSIRIALKKLSGNKMLKYSKNGVLYTIPLDDILYITRDSIERKCIIKTDYLEMMISKQLNELKEELTDSFIYSHRSCIVNKKRIRFVDLPNHKIFFDNKESTNLVSNIFKKEFDVYDN